MILVIGATAHFGRQTVETLADAGRQVRALSRDPKRAGLPEAVGVVRGDLTEPSTLGPALHGVTELFLVLPHGLDARPLLERARQAGVRHVVFLSSGAVVDGADGADGADAQPVHERDVAEAAAAVLGSPEHVGRAYGLTGPRSLTQTEQVEVLGLALGRELRFEEVADQAVRQQLGQFMDAEFVGALLDLMAATTGKPAALNDTIEQLTGHPARPYAQWAEDHLADFR